ncbi:MAG: hypothetical protein WCI03_08275 [bacterium]
MNGFLAIQPGATFSNAESFEKILLRLGISQVQNHSVGGGATYLWGTGIGDVRQVCSPRGNSLILNGYVTEMCDYHDVGDQRGVACFALKELERDDSLEHISDFVGKLNGSFSMVYHNRVGRRITCITDRVASRPVWIARASGGWALSSNPCALAASCGKRRFDCASLASLLLYGGPVQPEKSLFEEVNAAPPGCLIELQESGSRSDRFWYRFTHRPDETITMGNWIDVAADRLTRAAVRIARLHPSPAIFFSGGVDSRLTAAALAAAGSQPRLVTLGDSVNLEVRIATAAAKLLHLKHQVIIRDNHWYLDRLLRSVFESGGSFLWVHSHFSRAAESILGNNLADSFMLGDFCEAFSKLCCSSDVVRGDHCNAEELTAQFDRLPLPLYRPQNREATLALLLPDVRINAQEELKLRVRNRFEKLIPCSADPMIVLDQFFRWQSAATIATFSMFLDLRSVGSECNLMFDREVHELLEVLPARIRNKGDFGARLISRLNWRVGWVPNSNSLIPLCFPAGAHRLAKQFKPVLGRLRRQMMGDSHRTTGSWPKKALLYSLDSGWRDTFADLVNEPDALLDQYFDREAIRRCWRDFMRGDVKRAPDLEKLVNLTILTRLLDNR